SRVASRPDMNAESKWKHHGVRDMRTNELDINTAQTPGMNRAAAITNARAGAEKLWAGTVVIHPKAKTGAHHHGPVESVIYVVSGRARMRWGDKLEFVAEAGPGDFISVPPYGPHQEGNASDDQPLAFVLVRRGQEPDVVNLVIPVVEERAGATAAAAADRAPGPISLGHQVEAPREDPARPGGRGSRERCAPHPRQRHHAAEKRVHRHRGSTYLCGVP